MTMADSTATRAFASNQLRKEILEMSDVDNAAYLLDFLHTHAFNWAVKQYSMTLVNAREYAMWYVNTFGTEWVNDVTAPPHSGWTVFKYARSLGHREN